MMPDIVTGIFSLIILLSLIRIVFSGDKADSSMSAVTALFSTLFFLTIKSIGSFNKIIELIPLFFLIISYYLISVIFKKEEGKNE